MHVDKCCDRNDVTYMLTNDMTGILWHRQVIVTVLLPVSDTFACCVRQFCCQCLTLLLVVSDSFAGSVKQFCCQCLTVLLSVSDSFAASVLNLFCWQWQTIYSQCQSVACAGWRLCQPAGADAGVSSSFRQLHVSRQQPCTHGSNISVARGQRLATSAWVKVKGSKVSSVIVAGG